MLGLLKSKNRSVETNGQAHLVRLLGVTFFDLTQVLVFFLIYFLDLMIFLMVDNMSINSEMFVTLSMVLLF